MSVYEQWGKRFFDIVFSLIALVLLLPLMIVVSLLIVVFDPGPVIYYQARVGRDGDQFMFFKFRSMPINTGNMPSDQVGKVKIGWVGRVIRRTSIDELPQLINVLRGDMSIVGPRPPILQQDELVALRKQNSAIGCRPGLTGLAQVSSFDGMTVAEKASFDGEYAKQITMYSDIKIILRTFLYLLKTPPVY